MAVWRPTRGHSLVVFYAMDRDKNGKVTRSEFGAHVQARPVAHQPLYQYLDVCHAAPVRRRQTSALWLMSDGGRQSVCCALLQCEAWRRLLVLLYKGHAVECVGWALRASGMSKLCPEPVSTRVIA
jgi:hypothetical protein